MLRINDVVAFEETRYRILDVSKIRYTWINIDSDKSLPERISLAEVDELIHAEALKKLTIPFRILQFSSRNMAREHSKPATNVSRLSSL